MYKLIIKIQSKMDNGFMKIAKQVVHQLWRFWAGACQKDLKEEEKKLFIFSW
jgi:hypothetical protein